MKLTYCKFELKKEDCWIGAFWRKSYVKTDSGPKMSHVDVWLCLIPMVPLHLIFVKNNILIPL